MIIVSGRLYKKLMINKLIRIILFWLAASIMGTGIFCLCFVNFWPGLFVLSTGGGLMTISLCIPRPF